MLNGFVECLKRVGLLISVDEQLTPTVVGPSGKLVCEGCKLVVGILVGYVFAQCENVVQLFD